MLLRRVLIAMSMATIMTGFVPQGHAEELPRIAVDEQRHEFGVVASGTVLQHIFEIRNAGGGVLEIREVKPS